MDALEQREEGFEKRFAMQEEFRFRALARRNWRLCHVWTAPDLLRWTQTNTPSGNGRNNNHIRVPSFIPSGAPFCHHFGTKLGAIRADT